MIPLPRSRPDPADPHVAVVNRANISELVISTPVVTLDAVAVMSPLPRPISWSSVVVIVVS